MKKICAVAILAAGLAAPASPKTMTCRGEVKTGTLDNAVGECGFVSTGAEAVFKVCKILDEREDASVTARFCSKPLTKKKADAGRARLLGC